MSTIKRPFQNRRDTAANWTANNPILLSGQIGLETDTNKFKWGDGVTAWNSLSYFGIGSGITGVSSFNSRTGTVTPATNDYTWAQIDKTTSSLADVTNHSHTVLTDIGVNTHATIDTHLASTSNPHSTKIANLADVTLTSIADKDLLKYDSATSKFINITLANFKTSLALTKSDVGLGNVENTALSTWAGTTNITTLGTIATGTWQGTAIADTYISSASTWNAKQAALTFSTGLTNTANTITNNLSVGVSGGQTAIGGTGITDVLSLKGTTGNGTLTSPAIQALVGNNGGTTALTILNNGNVGIVTTSPSATLDVQNGTNHFRVGGTVSSDMDLLVGSNGGGTLSVGGPSNGTARTQISSTYWNYFYTETNPRIQVSRDEMGSGQAGIAFNYTAVDTVAKNGSGIGSPASQALGLFTSNGTALMERMRIDNNGNVGIGTTSPNSSLHNNGSFALPIVSKIANYTLTSSDHTVIASGAGTTITLPTAVNIQGRIYVIKRNDSTNNITVNTTSLQTIDGATSLTLSTNYQVIMVQSDNANWQIISAQ